MVGGGAPLSPSYRWAFAFLFNLTASCYPMGYRLLQWPRWASSASDLKEIRGRSTERIKGQANLKLCRFHCGKTESYLLLNHQGMRDLMIHPHPGLKWSMLVTRQTTQCLCFIPVATGNVVRVPKKGNFLEHFLELSLGWGEGGRANRTKHKNKTNIKISSLSFWETFPTSMVA